MDAYEVQKCLDPRSYGGDDHDSWRYWVAYNNKQLLALKLRNFEEFRVKLKEWLPRDRSHLESFLADEAHSALQQADTALIDYAITHRWSAAGPQVTPHYRERARFIWHGRDARYASVYPDRRPLADIRVEMNVVLGRLRKHLAHLHRWSNVLCQGLAAKPTVIATSTQVPREVPRLIVHPRQTEQDALNEMASRLAHPPQGHVAYVRLPTSYHKVRLTPPLQMIASSRQVDEVRARSQNLYRVDQPGAESEPPDKPEPPQQQPREGPPRISRFPRQARESDSSESEEESPSKEEGEGVERSG
jgi:hypothetical protein